MGLGLPGAYGGAALHDELLRIIADRRAQEQLAAQAQQQQFENDAKLRMMGQADRRMDIDAGQFDARLGFDREKLGEDVRQYNEGAPQREAGRLYTQAQTRHLEETPLRMESDRQAGEAAAKTQHGYRMAEIGAQQASRPESGWSLQPFTDPKTNTTAMFRVNSQTGATEPIQSPAGMQPGGHRQTRLSAAQQDDLATMQTVEDMANQAQALGDKINWKGVGGLWTGTVSQQLMRHTGWGTPQQEELRNVVSNIQGTIAKLRGGTSFTVNEQALLDSYTPTKDDGDEMIQAKLKSLINFIQTKRKNTLQYAGADMGAPPDAGNAGGGVEYDWVNGDLVPRQQ